MEVKTITNQLNIMKKFYFLLFALLAIATGMQATDYGFKMLSYSITSDNYQKLSAGKAWYYDPAANVLHLTEGTISTAIPNTTILRIDGDVNPTLKIQVDGNCSFTGTFSSGIEFVGNGQHTICGNGTLTMNSSRTDPQVILSYGNTSLTIKDVTINIEAWGPAAVGLVSNRFYEVILDYCEMNIKTSGLAWAAFGGNGVSPKLKKCFLSNGVFSGTGNAYDSDGNLKEAYIKRSTCVVSVNVDEPVVGNSPSFNCTANSEEYYATTVEWHGVRDSGYHFVLPNGYTYQMGETYRVYAILYPTEGNRFAEEEDLTIYVNGKEAEIDNMSSGFVTLKYTFPALVGTSYDLWVGGVQVNDFNKDNIDGNGKMKYNPATSTLSLLDGVTITGQGSATDGTTGYGAGIYSEVDGLTIDVASGGVEVIGADDCHGIYLRGKTTIKGEGSLSGKGYIGVFMGSNSADLTIDGNVMLVAEGITSNGLCGYVRGFAGNIFYYTTLTIKGKAKVMAKGELSSVRNWNDLVLEDSHAITSPTGAVWNADKHAVCDASGNPIVGEWVVIKRLGALKGDVNLDGDVTIADGVAVLNAMAGQSVPGNPDINGDSDITIADFVAVLNIMAGQ